MILKRITSNLDIKLHKTAQINILLTFEHSIWI